MGQLGKIFTLLMFPCFVHFGVCFFQSGKEYVYSYSASSSTGVLLPSHVASMWIVEGTLLIQSGVNLTIFQLLPSKISVWNGQSSRIKESREISKDVPELTRPFAVYYKSGLLEDFASEVEPPWLINIKRSVAGIFQLDAINLEKHIAFHSIEKNHYGQCNVDYVVSVEDNNERFVRKTFDPRTCVGHPERNWSNAPQEQCTDDVQNPILKSSERIYRVRTNGSVMEHILFVNASGGIYMQPHESHGEAQYFYTRQSFELLDIHNVSKEILTHGLKNTMLEHELPGADLTQGRGRVDKSDVFKSVDILLDRLSQWLENPGLDINVNNLHNSTISLLLYDLAMLNLDDFQVAYYKISGTSYKEETIRNIFLETLPQVGTKDAALFIHELIQERKVSDITAIQLLTQLPFHIRKPEVELLLMLHSFLQLPTKVSTDVQNTAILTYGTLIYKTCMVHCPYELLDSYVRLYLDKFTETEEYDKKMIWLEGLANIKLGRVVEFLEPIASGSSMESTHFRALAAWAFLPTARLRPDVMYSVYWPILVNRTEPLEIRVIALSLLLISSPTQNRLISLYWYMHTERSAHLYNYFYTTLKSVEHSTHPCYVHIGRIAAQFTRVLRKPQNSQYLLTGNYLFDYRDAYRKFGLMIHGIVVANPVTNIPEVFYISLNNYGSGINIGRVSLYIKAEGLSRALPAHLGNPTHVKDILRFFKLEEKHFSPVHLEVIARFQEKTVVCLHLNRSTIVKGFEYLSSLTDNMLHMYQNMEFHVNQQRINVPLSMESVQATDLGTNARLAFIGTSISSIRGNFTRSSHGRKNHVILRISIHGTEMIETYNPLLDIWHGVERTQSVHAYLPINITIGLEERPFVSYNTPRENLKMGIIAHAKTVTNIRSRKINVKLKNICMECPVLYTVSKEPGSDTMVNELFSINLEEFGGRISASLFDCENAMSKKQVISDVLLSHRTNSQIWPIMQFPLLALHFLDYFKYVPPKGSCGIAFYIDSANTFNSQVRLEYLKVGDHHMLSLIHSNLKTSEVLQQWNLASLYQVTSWISDILKVKATYVVPGEKIMKYCIEMERDTPWEWDFLSTKPSEPSRIKLSIVWGSSNTARGKCDGSVVIVHLQGEVNENQLSDSLNSKWPYNKCREESKEKKFIPYTHACYETSRELSTLRRYQISVQYKNLPENLSRAVQEFTGFYNLLAGNFTTDSAASQYVISAEFPQYSNIGQVQLNGRSIAIEYNYDFVHDFLVRTRIHKYMDMLLFRTFFSSCVVTPDLIKSAHNVTYAFKKDREILLFGQCYAENPKFALTAQNVENGINITLTDENETIYIVPRGAGVTIYNSTMNVPLRKDFMFENLSRKRFRMDEKSVDILLLDIFLFIHWTQEQLLFFFPNYILEFTCGLCAAQTSNIDDFYEKSIS